MCVEGSTPPPALAALGKLRYCKRASCVKIAASSTGINGFIMVSSEHAKIDQLFVFSEKQDELSPSDVSAVQLLLAAGASVANGMGASRLVHCHTRWQ